jgi:hypothetical protein
MSSVEAIHSIQKLNSRFYLVLSTDFMHHTYIVAISEGASPHPPVFSVGPDAGGHPQQVDEAHCCRPCIRVPLSTGRGGGDASQLLINTLSVCCWSVPFTHKYIRVPRWLLFCTVQL